jgi:manganese transport protein
MGQVAYHAVVPWIHGSSAMLLVVGIVGATIMPHVVYLHAGLTQNRIVARSDEERRQIFRFEKIDVAIAMAAAGLVNMAMLYMAASVFHHGHANVATIPTAFHTLTPLLGGVAAAVFLISLLASGLSSSAVGTMAGQMIMQGFVGYTIPVWIRRVVTMAPTVVIIAMGVNPTMARVVSQVVLSLVLPIPLLALTIFTNRGDIMGSMVNRIVGRLMYLGTGVILFLNVILTLADSRSSDAQRPVN